MGEEHVLHLLHDASAHIHEPSWSEANAKAWLWVGATDELTVFKIADNRGADVARSILGIDEAKVVISDRFLSYDWIEQHQYCWSKGSRERGRGMADLVREECATP